MAWMNHSRRRTAWGAALLLAVAGFGRPTSPALRAQDGEEDIQLDDESVIRAAWLDEQAAFALRLAERGWQDLADKVLAQTRQGDARVGQAKPSGDELIGVQRTEVRLRAQVAGNEPNLARRKEMGEAAAKQMKSLVDQLQKTMIEQFNRMNAGLEDVRRKNNGQIPDTPAIRASLGKLNAQAVQSRDTYEETQRDLASIHVDLGRAFARDADRAAKEEDRHFARAAAYDNFETALLGEDAIGTAAAYALGDRFVNAENRAAAARRPEQRQRAINNLEALLLTRARYNHKLEESFAAWATLVNRKRDEVFDRNRAKALTDVRTAADAKIKNIAEEEKKAAGNQARLAELKKDKDEATAERNRANGSLQRAGNLANLIRETGSDFFEMSARSYEMMPDDRQVYWHWMKFLAAYDDDLFISNPEAPGNETPNPINASGGRRPFYCDQCHFHANQTHKEVFQGNFLTKDIDNQKRRFERGGNKITDEKRTPRKVRNDETQKDEDTFDVVWTYDTKCTECHLHRIRYDVDVLEDPGKVPGDREQSDRPLQFYNRNSDRVNYLFNRYFVWPQVTVAGEFGGRATVERNTLDPYVRSRGLYGYADAMTSLAEGALRQLGAESRKGNSPRLPDLEAHAKELVAAAEDALTQISNPRPPIFGGRIETDATIRALARLEVAVPWWVTRARIAKATRQPESETVGFLRRALRECSLAQMEGGPAWKRRSQEGIHFTMQVSDELLGKDKLPPTSDVALARADDAYGRYSRLVRGTPERRAAAKEIRSLYLAALGEMAKIPYGAERIGQMPMALFRLADAANTREDFPTAYVALFQLLQEFNPRQYPASRFAVGRQQADRLVTFAAAGLPGLGRRMAALLDDPSIEIEALRMSVGADPEPPQERIAQYANLLKRHGRGGEALEIMTRVEPENPYYGLMQLNAAEIYREQMVEFQERANDAALPEADRKLAQADADRSFADLEKAVGHFLEKVNLENRAPRPDESNPVAQRTYDLYTARIPHAFLLPIQCLYEAKRYDEVIKRSDALVEAIGKLKDIDPDRRAESLNAALFRRFQAFFAQIDIAGQPFAEAQKRAEAAEAAMNRLAEIDPSGQYSNNAYQQVGRVYLELAEKARENGDEAAAGALGLRAAVTINKATRLAYQNMAAALRTATIFVQNGNFAEAVRVFNNAIDFWNDGLFTPDYLLRDGKEIAGLTAAKPADSLAGPFQAVAKAASWQGLGGKAAATAEAAAGRLNEFVNAGDWKALAGPVTAFVDAAIRRYPAGGQGVADDDAALGQKLADAKKLLGRDDLEGQPAIRRRLLRTVLEAAFPDWLQRAPAVASLPSESDFGAALRRFVQEYPQFRASQRKGAFLLAMHDQTALRGKAGERDSEAGIVAAHLEELRAKAADEKLGAAERRAARAELALFEPGLRTFLYGVERRGKRQQRSYGRARAQIRDMRDYNRRNPLPEGRDRAEMPTEPFLQEVEKALRFEQELLLARREYAQALVNVGGRENENRALTVFESLVDYYPDDSQLLMALAAAESQVAYNIATSASGYNDEASKHFIRARFRGQYLRDRLPPQSELWWAVTDQLQQNALREIRLRKEQNKTAGGHRERFEVPHPDGKRMVGMTMSTLPLQNQAELLFTEINRQNRLNSPEQENYNEEIGQKLDAIEKELRGLGFKPKEIAEITLDT